MRRELALIYIAVLIFVGIEVARVQTVHAQNYQFGKVTTTNINNIVLVDGNTYPLTSAGINAAITAAGPNGKVIVPPGAYTISSEILVNESNIEVTGYGAVFTCTVTGSACVFLNNSGTASMYTDISFKGFAFSPSSGTAGTRFAAIEDNGQVSKIEDISFVASSTYTFDYGIQIDNDQAAQMKGIDTNGGNNAVITKTSTFVGAAIRGLGGSNAPVGYVSKSNLSMQCSGNGILWAGGNSLSVEDTVIQSYSQYAILANAVGGQGAVTLTNVYREGGCTNPFGNISQADILMQGGRLVDTNPETGGGYPNFTTNGTAGTTLYQYWVVATLSGNSSVPLGAGYASAGNATLSGTNSINVVWPKIGTATTYALIRLTATAGGDYVSPSGTANIAVTTGYTQATCGTNVCTFIDTVPTGSLTSYTVPANTNYYPFLALWPGARVLSVPATGNEGSATSPATLITDTIGMDVSVNSFNQAIKNVTYFGGYKSTTANIFPYSPIADNSIGLNGTANYWPALLMPSQVDFGTLVSNIKGVLNLGDKNPASTNLDIITMIDGSYQATVATASHRPASNLGDGAICEDGANGLCTRAATSISEYINTQPDGSSYKRRLTSSAETLAVPVTAAGVYTDSSSGFVAGETVCKVSIALGTSAISSGAKGTAATGTCTGVATSSPFDVISCGFEGDPTSTTGYAAGAMLTIIPYPSSNTINVYQINNTGSSITPSALSVECRVTR
jgi:hypothetical protein